ncbi:hypothetical protein [Buchananella hordeovulneris]|uniref:Uncharacterized protein n=1 Tax=Buchananella hordeovulneris TaxID=52770 RepID=A0A1Q5PT68_9ACTO|nr:hypothetical protein [Buchananella hordeovulneris]OKL50763.1 hypothetical protein BSZ40_10760 [Buchananella hordeovulneris]
MLHVTTPAREDITSHLAGSGGLEPQVRDDLTEFVGSPAITIQFKKLRPSWETDPDYDGTILTTFTEIGDTRWVVGVRASTRAEAEAQRAQIAATMKNSETIWGYCVARRRIGLVG